MTAKKAKDLKPGDRIQTFNVDYPAGKPVTVRKVEVHQGRARIAYLGGPPNSDLTRWAEELVNLIEEKK